MLIEEQNRVINGASSHEFQTIGDENRLETIKINELKKIVENTDLQDLVYWKLNQMLENKTMDNFNEILKGVIADVERPLFTLILAKTNGNQSKAAKLLGCNRNTLHRKLKDFLINPKTIKKSTENNSYKKSPSIKENTEIYL